MACHGVLLWLLVKCLISKREGTLLAIASVSLGGVEGGRYNFVIGGAGLAVLGGGDRH